MGTQRRKFTPEFKQETVALVVRSGQSANQVAKDLGISQTSLSRWLRQAKTTPAKVNGFQAAEELKALRREVERLRMERDILKKTAVDSGGACNSCLQYRRRCLKPQRLPWTLVHAYRDRVQVCLGVA